MSTHIVEWRQREVLAEVSGRVADNLYRACEFAAEYCPQVPEFSLGKCMPDFPEVHICTKLGQILCC